MSSETPFNQTGEGPGRPPASLVSIVVPVFNGAPFLKESLDSLFAQNYPRFEVLVMDDASTDATPEILATYRGTLRVVRQTTTRGIYGNANDGIALCRGEFIAVFHADDIYAPNIIEREVDFLQRFPQSGAVFCQDIFVDPYGRETGRLALPPELRGGRPLSYSTILNALLKYKNRFLVCPTAMVRTSVYREVGLYRDEEFRNTADMEMWLRIVRRYPIGILEEYLLRYRHGHNSSHERYHRLRTDPERFFRIMDLDLAGGGRRFAAPANLRAFEAHRMEDLLMCGIRAYILNGSAEARSVLAVVTLRRLLEAPPSRRGRLLMLLTLLHCLVRAPRLPIVIQLLRRRVEHRLTTPLSFGGGAPDGAFS